MKLREQYWLEGPEACGEVELLALVLGTGTAGRSSLEVASALLTRFGGLAGLRRCDAGELLAVGGIGEVRALRVHAALQLGWRALSRRRSNPPVCCPEEANQWLAPLLRGRGEERLFGLYLDRRHRPVARRLLSVGSATHTLVDPAVIYRVALGVGARFVVIAHNHPSGDPSPSAQDIAVTRRVAQAGQVVGIPLLDHLVVGATGFVSLAERGVLAAWTGECDRSPPCIRR